MLPAITSAEQGVHQSNKSDLIAITFDKKWKILKHGDNKPTLFTHTNGVLRLDSQQSVAFYTYRLPRLSQISHCDWHISFQWRVLEARKLSSQKQKGRDDRPLAIHFWINDASQYGWLKGGLAKLFSIPTPGYMLSYSWGLSSERHQEFDNPHLPEKAYISVLRDETEVGEKWYEEELNISESVRRHFDSSLMDKPIYLVVSADTEDNQGAAKSEIKAIKLWHKECSSPSMKPKKN